MASGFFYSPWEDLHLAAWAAPTFTTLPNLSVEVGQPIAAAATTQVKLCHYGEVELAELLNVVGHITRDLLHLPPQGIRCPGEGLKLLPTQEGSL